MEKKDIRGEFSKSLQSNWNEFFWPKLSHAIATACSTLQLLLDDDYLMMMMMMRQEPLPIASPWQTLGARVLGAPSTPCISWPNVSLIKPLRSISIRLLSRSSSISGPFSMTFLPMTSIPTLPVSPPLNLQYKLAFVSCPVAFLARSTRASSHLVTFALVYAPLPCITCPRCQTLYKTVTLQLGMRMEYGFSKAANQKTNMAYKKQFEKDFTCFLQHRSQELVPGGLLFCVMIASKVDATSTSPMLDHYHLYTNLQAAWRQLVSEGLLEQGSLDTFNLPLFMPTVDEVKEVVYGDALRAQFEVMQVEYVEVERAPMHVWMESATGNAQTWGSTCEMMARNFVGSLIQLHLESAKFELLMERLRHVAAADDEVYRTCIIRLIVVALSRR